MNRSMWSFALLGLLLLSGCEDKYAEDLVYPLRSDTVVTGDAITDLNKDDKTLPQRFDRPGHLPNFLGNLPPEERKPLESRLKSQKAIMAPSEIPAEKKRELESELTKLFGTPAHPKVEGVDDAFKSTFKLDDATLALGSRLYRQHCLHCHGLTGDGRGPTGPWVNPHPRDYRRGIFKFTSSGQNYGAQRKARREDLVRTLRNGVEGTSMPSFRLLPDDEIDGLVSYVIHLSLRGELEFSWIEYNLLKSSDQMPMNELMEIIAKNWRDTEEKVIDPGKYPYATDEDFKKSVLRGKDLFMAQGAAGCLSCHTNFGRQSTFKYDDWGTIVRPANLTLGTYRGGRRPIDVFWRIHSGVNGSAMPASNTLKPEQIWDLVNFVQVLPYPKMLKEIGIELD